ncbi:SH3 domain-containing protein C23A1.17-like [Humulus lupulus]|uniref:SH3 domain-containing protein C23A1.17-like n=1 Tax=Humulus lupulus TaxID=3486 RepID=UPI002B408D43|nr:SH3 domain-containing protein C23A1.17-like [Humulus lupulus]
MVNAMRATLVAQGRVDPHGEVPSRQPASVPPMPPAGMPPVAPAGVPPEHLAELARDLPAGVPPVDPTGNGIPPMPHDCDKGKVDDNPTPKPKKAHQNPKDNQVPRPASVGEGLGARGHHQAVSTRGA